MSLGGCNQDRMDIGKITQLAKGEFGPHARCVYHQDLIGPVGQNHLKADDIGAGDLIFVDSAVSGSEPEHSSSKDGLLLSVKRPVASGTMGSWGAANVQNVPLPSAFLLIGVFARPSRVPLNAQYAEGTYAPSLLMSTGTKLIGATSQFRPEGIRLNVPPLGLNRASISPELQAAMTEPSDPSDFCLAFRLNRATAPTTGKAWLFVGNQEADSVSFTLPDVDASTPIRDLRAGIGTAGGIHYRASVYLLRFQIWTANS